MLHRLKKIIPESWLGNYHRVLSFVAAWRYGFPSEKLIVIGVTGTNGKTSTSILIGKILETGGVQVGVATTALFKIGAREWLNDKKMTMLGRFALQKLLRQMVEAGCKYAVIETSSQGIVQHRHRAINYDVAVFTNLTPEHIEAHGGFENYKQAKLQLFHQLVVSKIKKINGVQIEKTIVANADDAHAKDFLAFSAPKRFIFTIRGDARDDGFTPPMIPCVADQVKLLPMASQFTVRGVNFELPLPGKYNISNALAAIAVGFRFGYEFSLMAEALKKVTLIPGRMEFIEAGQDFKAVVDYAVEPVAMAKLYEVIDAIKPNRLIHILGSCGGGRDVSRRPILGEMAGKRADIVIVTNEDPYDDDPMEIIQQIAEGARKAGKIDQKNLFCIMDRAEAIREAVSLAQKDDLILLTGKGCEQAICVADGKKIPWDDRKKLRDAILGKK